MYMPHFRKLPYEIIASQTWHHSSSFHFMCTMSKPRSAIQRKPCAIKSRSPPSQPFAASPPFPHITGMGCSPLFLGSRLHSYPFVQFRTQIVLPRGRYSAKMFSRGRLLVLMNIVFRNLTKAKFWLKHACNNHMPSCFLLQPIRKGCESYIFVGWKRWSFRQPKSEPHRCILGSNSTSSNSSISMGSISPISGNPSISSSVLPLHRRQVT